MLIDFYISEKWFQREKRDILIARTPLLTSVGLGVPSKIIGLQN